MLDRDDYLDGMNGFQELEDDDDTLLDDDDREAEEAIAAWMKSREGHGRADQAASTGDGDAAAPAAPVTVRFDETTVIDGDLYMDCLTMFLLTQLDFELEVQGAAAGDEEAVPSGDRWLAQGEGMVPEDFRERLLRAGWKVERQWRVDLDVSPSPNEDYETQSRRFFRALAGCGVCRITEIADYENPFEGMTPMDFGDFPEDFDDDCAM
jgi:hypothetical protein